MRKHQLFLILSLLFACANIKPISDEGKTAAIIFGTGVATGALGSELIKKNINVINKNKLRLLTALASGSATYYYFQEIPTAVLVSIIGGSVAYDQAENCVNTLQNNKGKLTIALLAGIALNIFKNDIAELISNLS